MESPLCSLPIHHPSGTRTHFDGFLHALAICVKAKHLAYGMFLSRFFCRLRTSRAIITAHIWVGASQDGSTAFARFWSTIIFAASFATAGRSERLERNERRSVCRSRNRSAARKDFATRTPQPYPDASDETGESRRKNRQAVKLRLSLPR